MSDYLISLMAVACFWRVIWTFHLGSRAESFNPDQMSEGWRRDRVRGVIRRG